MNTGCSKLEEEADGLSLGSRTTVEARGKRAFATPGSAPEKVRIYAIDSKAGRTALDLAPTDPVADALFWYREHKTLVVVELKGCDLQRAVKQLEHTVSALKVLLKQTGCNSPGPKIRGLVVYRGGAPRGFAQKHSKDFRDTTGHRLDFASTSFEVDRLLRDSSS